MEELKLHNNKQQKCSLLLIAQSTRPRSPHAESRQQLRSQSSGLDGFLCVPNKPSFLAQNGDRSQGWIEAGQGDAKQVPLQELELPMSYVYGKACEDLRGCCGGRWQSLAYRYSSTELIAHK